MKLNMKIKKNVNILMIIVFILLLGVSYYGTYISNGRNIDSKKSVNAATSPIITRARRVNKRNRSEVETAVCQSEHSVTLEETFFEKFHFDAAHKFYMCVILLALFSILPITSVMLFVLNIRRWLVKSCQFKFKEVFLQYVHLKDGKKDAGIVNFAF